MSCERFSTEFFRFLPLEMYDKTYISCVYQFTYMLFPICHKLSRGIFFHCCGCLVISSLVNNNECRKRFNVYNVQLHYSQLCRSYVCVANSIISGIIAVHFIDFAITLMPQTATRRGKLKHLRSVDNYNSFT